MLTEKSSRVKTHAREFLLTRFDPSVEVFPAEKHTQTYRQFESSFLYELDGSLQRVNRKDKACLAYTRFNESTSQYMVDENSLFLQ